MDEIDISNPPLFCSHDMPIEAYVADPAEFENDEIVVTEYDVGVVGLEKNVPPPKERAKPRPRKRIEELANVEMVKPLIAIPDLLRDTVIGRLADTVSECLEFPEASVFMVLLSSASSSVATSYAVQYQTKKTVALGLYTVIEHPPGTKKSYILDIGMVPYSKAIGEHNKKVRGKLREAQEGDSNLYPHLRTAFNVATDATSAAMDKRLSESSEGRFVIASAEQSAFMSLFPEAGTFSSNNELILKGFAGEYVAGMRGGRNAYEGTAQGSITLVAQTGSARRVFAASSGSGLAERFFFLAEPDFVGHRKHEGNFPTDEDQEDFRRAINACMRTYSDNILSYRNLHTDDHITYDPENLIQLRATNAGYQLIRDKAIINEPRMGELKESGDMIMMSWLSKYETFVLKVAGIVHVVECLGHGSQVPQTIPDKWICAAMDLVDVMADHIQELIRECGESGSDAEQSAIIACLEKPMPMRALREKLRGRKPFRSMPGSGYKIIGKRVEAMINQGMLVVGTDGRISVV